MKVICKENTAEHLDLNEVKGVSCDTVYPLIKGKEYIVMGVMMLRDSNCLYYLVDEDGQPYWVPYGLFDVSDNQVSFNWAINDWSIKVFSKKDYLSNLFYLVGFNELCNDEKYYDDLMKREQYALDIYFKRKAEIQALYDEQPSVNQQ